MVIVKVLHITRYLFFYLKMYFCVNFVGFNLPRLYGGITQNTITICWNFALGMLTLNFHFTSMIRYTIYYLCILCLRFSNVTDFSIVFR